MSRILINSTENLPDAHQDLFNQINSAFGVVPNMFKVIGNSSAALESMWTSFGALAKGSLDPILGEKIAVHIAEINSCEYCLAAHTVLGQKAGASVEDMSLGQAGKAHDEKTQAVLDFSGKLVNNRAHISDEDVNNVREAGFNDAQIAEILAHVALNIFTNYTNVAFAVPIDFPQVKLNSNI